jgi:hypothetical protein
LESQKERIEARTRARAAEGAKLRKARLEMGRSISQFLPLVQLKHVQHLAQMEQGKCPINPRVRVWMQKQGLFDGKAEGQ